VIALVRHRAVEREGGFTLIELLVACLLLAIVLIVTFAVILDIFRSSERTRQRSKAQRNISQVSERLTSDIEAMRAPNRNPKDTGGLEMMREGFTVSDHFWEIHDIVLAQPDRLIFYAELNSVGEKGTAIDTECIEWFVAPDQAIRRRVYPYSKNCADAVAQRGIQKDEEIVPAPDAGGATDKDFHSIFSYYITEVPPGEDYGSCAESHIEEMPGLGTNTVGGVGETTEQGAFDPSTANRVPVSVPGLGPQQLDRIVAIELDLRSLVSLKGSRGEAHFTQKLVIPSRQQYEFRYAIGCAE
jgi:type II secretory pathway component PulJ